LYIVFTINYNDMLTKFFTIALIVLSTSCNSAQETVQETDGDTMNKEQSDNKAMDAQMLIDGFHIGELKQLKDSVCEFIILDLVTKAKFDPINISEDIYKSIRNDGEKVYYKYRPLRMMNRCNVANPISLIDIKKREG